RPRGRRQGPDRNLEARLLQERMRLPASTRAAAALALAVAASAFGGCGSAGGTSAATTSGATGPSGLAGAYSPSIDPANFVSKVDNPYLPYIPGTVLHYQGVMKNGTTP